MKVELTSQAITNRSMNTYKREIEARRPRSEFEDTPRDRFIAAGVFSVLIALAVASLAYGVKAVVAGVSYAEASRATGECEKWADEAKVYPGYFLAPWQKMQCDTYGVAIDAPVATYQKQ